MVFPASTQSVSQGFSEAKETAVKIRRLAVTGRDAMAAGAVSANAVIQLAHTMQKLNERLAAIAAIPGMANYAKDQFGDPEFDIAAEFTSITAAANSVVSWITTNFPKSPNGYIEKDIIEANGAITVRQFNSTQSEGLRTVLDTLVATIG